VRRYSAIIGFARAPTINCHQHLSKSSLFSHLSSFSFLRRPLTNITSAQRLFAATATASTMAATVAKEHASSSKPFASALSNRAQGSTYTSQEVESILVPSSSLRQLQKDKFNSLLRHIGPDCRVVMIGEASHGTEEFYRVRAAITKELIEKYNFSFVALEADWPDTYRLNRWVQLGKSSDRTVDEALEDFVRFPTWMWRNHAVAEFATWLRSHNEKISEGKKRAGIYGLDLYSMYTSAEEVVNYLEKVDSRSADIARQRYSTLGQFGEDPHSYPMALRLGWIDSQRKAVVQTLADLQKKRMEYVGSKGWLDGDEYFFAEVNAKVVKDAEEYYRKGLDADELTWNLRDQHMFNTLLDLMRHHGERQGVPESQVRCVVWAHNTHIHDARASEMSIRGELNIGQLVRQHFGLKQSFSIGFSTYNGTVTAASNWGGRRQKMTVRPSIPGSYEHMWNHCVSATSKKLYGKPESKSSSEETKGGGELEKEVKRSVLDHSIAFVIRSNEESEDEKTKKLRDVLTPARLQRAIGVQYKPERERGAHYHYAVVPLQFDSMIHIDKTSALQPLEDEIEPTELHGEAVIPPPAEERLEG